MRNILVPKVFHRIWLGSPEPEQFKAWGASWARHHPDWTVKTWTMETLPRSRYPNMLNRCPRISDQVDILRYELLLQEGGVYLDADMECFRNIEPLIEGAEAFVARHDLDPADIYAVNTSVIGATKGHSFVRDLVETVPCTDPETALSCGPQYITAISKRHADVRVFNRKLFQPFRWDELSKAGQAFPEAYAAHHWSSKWHPAPAALPRFDYEVPLPAVWPIEPRIRYAVDVADAVPGWMGRDELSWLARQASVYKVVVEFGTFQGRSAKAMALSGAGHVICVDLFNWTHEAFPKMSVHEAAHKHLWPELQAKRVTLQKDSTQAGAAKLRKWGVVPGMVFIDACHDYAPVMRDIQDGIALLGGPGSGGLLCGHDFNPAAYPGVVAAVKKLVPGYELPTGWIWAKRI